jgi:hypothetical protein
MERRELKRNRRSLTGHKLSCSILAIGQEFVENIEGRGSSCNLLVWNMEWRHLREKGGKIVVVDGGGHFGSRELVLDNFRTSLSG